VTTQAGTPRNYPAYWKSYSLLHWLLMVVALVLIAIWWLSQVVSGFSAPDWIAPTGCLCLIVGLWIP